jgi:hypothetical protein
MTRVTRCDFVFVFISGFSVLLLASSSFKFLSCTRTSLPPHLNLTSHHHSTTTSPTHKTTWTPTVQPPPLWCPSRRRFHFRRQNRRARHHRRRSTATRRIRGRRCRRRPIRWFRSDSGFGLLLRPRPSGGRSTNAWSTSGTTIAQGLRIGGGMKVLKP